MDSTFLPIKLVLGKNWDVSFSQSSSIRLAHNTYERKIISLMKITTVNYLLYIKIPYVKGTWKGLRIHMKYPALIIFDIFKRHFISDVLQKLKGHNMWPSLQKPSLLAHLVFPEISFWNIKAIAVHLCCVLITLYLQYNYSSYFASVFNYYS